MIGGWGRFASEGCSATPVHELRAEFVAVDHWPFQPRLQTVVTFSVQP